MISMLFYTFFKEHELYNKMSISFNDVKEIKYRVTIKDTEVQRYLKLNIKKIQ